MNLTTAAIPNPAATAMSVHEAGQRPSVGGADFESALTAAGETGSRGEVRKAAQQLVSQAFLMPMMKMMRDDPFKSDLFHGGQGEDIFAAQLDEKLADSMASQMNLPVVEAVYQKFAAQLSPNISPNLGTEVDHNG
ncbi:MAG: rod-binding protein [Phycisphaeraceae bacterium]